MKYSFSFLIQPYHIKVASSISSNLCAGFILLAIGTKDPVS